MLAGELFFLSLLPLFRPVLVSVFFSSLTPLSAAFLRSVASLLTTSECCVVDAPEEKGTAGPPGGGMGGMGGMGGY